MKKSTTVISAHPDNQHGSLRSYSIGFALSIILTILPFSLVMTDTISGTAVVVALLGFAIAQLAVQLRFFIHLGYDPQPRWNRLIVVFTALVVFIIVVGSIWIMNNLDYNMMPHEMEEYILEEEAIRR